MFLYTQSTPSTSWLISHDQGDNPMVNVSVDYEGTNQMILPLTVQIDNTATVIVTFSTPRTGSATIHPASGYTHYQLAASTTWSVPHNLNCNPALQVYVWYDGTLQRILPLDITINDSNNLTITFSEPQSGRAFLR